MGEGRGSRPSLPGLKELSLMADVVMPRLSDSMEEGTVLQWLKKVGDEVAVGDELVEIETDKANMAYESDGAGALAESCVREGEGVAFGPPMAWMGNSAEGSEVSAAEDRGTSASAAGPIAGEGGALRAGHGPSSTPPTPTPPAEDADDHRTKASPLARRIAREKQLDLSQLQGSGPGGRIVKADVEKASSAGDAEAAAAGPAAETTSPETAKGQVTYEDLSKTQQVIARRMSESKATAPHFYLRALVDMSRAVEGRALVKAGATEGDVVPSFNDMVVKACALALREHPRANGAYRDGRFELYSRVNVGVAVAAKNALLVPTRFDADRKGLRQIASDSRALAQRVRDGQITPPELSGATFTVSNLGMYGIDAFAAVINPPPAESPALRAIGEGPGGRGGGGPPPPPMQGDPARRPP